MATAATEPHNDVTTVHVEFKAGGTIAGVPHDYGDVNWKHAVLADGPPMIWWNFGLLQKWGPKKRGETSTMINNLIRAKEPLWFLTGGNDKHETGPGP